MSDIYGNSLDGASPYELPEDFDPEALLDLIPDLFTHDPEDLR